MTINIPGGPLEIERDEINTLEDIQIHHLAAVLKRGRPLVFNIRSLLSTHFLLLLSLTFNYERWVLTQSTRVRVQSSG